MAQVHNQSAEWTLPSNFERHAWDEGGLLGEAPFWGRFWDLSLLSSVQRQRLLEVREHARADLLRFGKSRENYGLNHAALLPENILRNRTEDRKIVVEGQSVSVSVKLCGSGIKKKKN